jgi:hypothetical protein
MTSGTAFSGDDLRLLPDSPELPLRTPEPGATVALFAQALDGAPMSRPHVALVGDEPADVAEELRGIVAEIYDTLERAWPLLSVVERCAPEIPELETVWFGEGRADIHRPGRVPAAAGGQWAVAPDARRPHGGARGRRDGGLVRLAPPPRVRRRALRRPDRPRTTIEFV